MNLSTRIKDAGITIRHSRGYIISILQGLEMGWRGMKWCVHSQEIVNMGQLRPKVTNKNPGFNFLDVRKIDGFPPEASASLLASKF